MSHLDEGTLHALLDGELDSHEVAEIQAHLGACSSCGLRLREVKEFLSEADRLIASVNLDGAAIAAPRPATVPPAPAAARPEAEARPPAATRPEPPAQAARKWEPWNEPPPPVLLVPDNEPAAERRMRRLRRFGWAAIVMVVAGAGWVEARKMMPVGPLPADTTASRTTAVVAPEETSRPDTSASAPAAAALGKLDSGANKADSAPPPAILARKPSPPRPKAAASPAAKAPPPAAEDTQADALAARDEAPADSAGSGRAADQPTDSATAERADTGGVEDLATVRARASEALADLDRERRLKQAAAATAALDAQRRRSTAAQPQAAPARVQQAAAPTPPPAPPTLEQRAQIYLRIGLDEASRQLGGPAHVLEGLSPLFMGLVQGSAVGGADPGRPVVRVVYQDSQGRLILLDQQRLRAGQSAPPASTLSWTLGPTAMWLRGEASAEILRTYRTRVR